MQINSKMEEEFLVKFTGGNTAALKSVFDRFFLVLCIFSEKITGDLPASEDIVVEKFVLLWTKRASFKSVPEMKKWLFVSTRNASLDHIRDLKRLQIRKRGFQYLFTNNVEWADTDGEERSAEVLVAIYNYINSFPSQRREIILMTYINGMKSKEIAHQLNISPENVRKQRKVALDLLKEKFSDTDLAIFFLLAGAALELTLRN